MRISQIAGLLAALAFSLIAATACAPTQTVPTPQPTVSADVPTPRPPAVVSNAAQAQAVKLQIDPQAVPPKDVLELVSFSIPASGRLSSSSCAVQGSTSVLPQAVELGAEAKWCGCGFTKDESYHVRIVDHKGTTIWEEQGRAYNECVNSRLPADLFSPDDPLGLYTLEIVSQNTYLAQAFTLKLASTPRLIRIPTGYLLAGFHPHEQVRLLAYNNRFAGEWQVSVEDDGMLTIELDEPVALFAVGKESGDAPTNFAGEDFTGAWIKYDGTLYYNGTVEAVRATVVRAVPTPAGQTTVNIAPGTHLELGYELRRNSAHFWWNVTLANGMTGWVVEDDLRPIDPYEPNDSSASSSQLPLTSKVFQSSGYTTKLSLISPGDEDWFALPIDGVRFISIHLYLRNQLDPTKITATLYAEDGTLIMQSHPYDKTGLELSSPLSQPGRYLLKVTSQGNWFGAYDMRISDY